MQTKEPKRFLTTERRVKKLHHSTKKICFQLKVSMKNIISEANYLVTAGYRAPNSLSDLSIPDELVLARLRSQEIHGQGLLFHPDLFPDRINIHRIPSSPSHN